MYINNSFEYSIKTTKEDEFVNITNLVQKSVNESKIQNGTALIFSTHTTAGITINENADSDVVRDILVALDKVFPKIGDYRHMEGNSHAHLKTSYTGSSTTVIVENGRLKLGVWQGIYFCEFDGPRNRKVYIKISED